MVPLALAWLLLVPARAESDAQQRAEEAAALSRAAVQTGDSPGARARAAAAFEGELLPDDAATPADKSGPRRRLRLSSARERHPEARTAPPAPVGAPANKKLSKTLVMAGGGALGALQGFVSAGLVGAAAGGVLGLGAAWLYTHGHHGAAFGATAGGIIGSALGGPIGGLIGAVVGAGLGFLAGKLFGL